MLWEEEGGWERGKITGPTCPVIPLLRQAGLGVQLLLGECQCQQQMQPRFLCCWGLHYLHSCAQHSQLDGTGDHQLLLSCLSVTTWCS